MQVLYVAYAANGLEYGCSDMRVLATDVKKRLAWVGFRVSNRDASTWELSQLEPLCDGHPTPLPGGNVYAGSAFRSHGCFEPSSVSQSAC